MELSRKGASNRWGQLKTHLFQAGVNTPLWQASAPPINLCNLWHSIYVFTYLLTYIQTAMASTCGAMRQGCRTNQHHGRVNDSNASFHTQAITATWDRPAICSTPNLAMSRNAMSGSRSSSYNSSDNCTGLQHVFPTMYTTHVRTSATRQSTIAGFIPAGTTPQNNT